MSKLIILRDENFGRPQGGDPFTFGMGPSAPMSGLGAGDPPAPSLSIEDVSKADMRDLGRDPAVRAVAAPMPTKLIEPMAGQGADAANATWGVAEVGAVDSPFDGAGVKVAVLDTGIDPNHEAFAGVTLDMKNFTGGPDDTPDGQGHGTHCAGTVFGRDTGGKRIGVATGVTDAMIGKVLADSGGGSSEMLFAGMQWAQQGGAKVISMSLGFDFPGMVKRLVDAGWPTDLAASAGLEAYRANLRAFDALMDMFRAMAQFDGGTVVVAASGNESRRDQNPNFEVSASLPSAAVGVVSVGALQQGGNGLTVAGFSNTNPILSAPGVNVESAAVGGGTVAFNGTSMACPHVAGVAALWWQALSGTPVPLSADGVKARMRATADRTVFAAGVDIADRGDGLAKAPSANMM
ncbi:S8 family serine peptidase [Tropicibacter sp. R15_0]|uniref:S8 family peptidase n=1 Tax=Tropicibacter sp. R15_0 TaxID=2821101 RepID=UPI001ADC0C45|nr:S8 family serine peptidase [Tropicibacter sp. R15_0]MBO9467085.1 S8 family serine peptidase [Tropicibacter sp. R15_0]